MIRLYHKILEKFVSLVVQDRFWVVHIPFDRMVRFKLLAQFPLYHLPHPVISDLKPVCVNFCFRLMLYQNYTLSDPF